MHSLEGCDVGFNEVFVSDVNIFKSVGLTNKYAFHFLCDHWSDLILRFQFRLKASRSFVCSLGNFCSECKCWIGQRCPHVSLVCVCVCMWVFSVLCCPRSPAPFAWWFYNFEVCVLLGNPRSIRPVLLLAAYSSMQAKCELCVKAQSDLDEISGLHCFWVSGKSFVRATPTNG